MYLNAYVPQLQYESGVAAFFRHHRGQPFASSALMVPISKAFVAAIHGFVQACRSRGCRSSPSRKASGKTT